MSALPSLAQMLFCPGKFLWVLICFLRMDSVLIHSLVLLFVLGKGDIPLEVIDAGIQTTQGRVEVGR